MSCVRVISRGVLASSVPARDLLAFVHLDERLLGDRVRAQDLAVAVLDDDLRMQVALVLDDHLAADLGGRVDFLAHRLVLDDVLEADACRRLRRGSGPCAGPTWPAPSSAATLAPSSTRIVAPAGTVTRSSSRPFSSTMWISPLRVRASTSPFGFFDDVQVVVLDDAGLLGADFGFLDAAAGGAADVERTHGQLRAGLADGLRGDDADRQAFLDQLAAGEVHAVAARADADRRFAGQRRAHADLLEAELLEPLGRRLGDQFVLRDDQLVVDQADDVVARDAAADAAAERHFDRVALADDALGDAVERAAVEHADDDVLRHVGQLAGQVAGVGGLERGVGQTLARAVRGAEVLQHAQPFAEVRLDGRLDDSPGRLGHQAAHAGELADLLQAAARAGLDHQADRVQVGHAVAHVGAQAASSSPRRPASVACVQASMIEVVALAFGDRALLEVLLDAVDFRLRSS